MLEGREVIALTGDTAAIRGQSASVTIYRKNNKLALGPVGDSLDDLNPSGWQPRPGVGRDDLHTIPRCSRPPWEPRVRARLGHAPHTAPCPNRDVPARIPWMEWDRAVEEWKAGRRAEFERKKLVGRMQFTALQQTLS